MVPIQTPRGTFRAQSQTKATRPFKAAMRWLRRDEVDWPHKPWEKVSFDGKM